MRKLDTHTAIIEIPKNNIYKYEIKNNKLILDRKLNQPCPSNYGYVPNTLWHDGDPLDVFIISSAPIHPGSHVKFSIHTAFKCIDTNVSDDKIIGILYGELMTFSQLEKEIDKIIKYLNSYKRNKFKVLGEYTPKEINSLVSSMYIRS